MYFMMICQPPPPVAQLSLQLPHWEYESGLCLISADICENFVASIEGRYRVKSIQGQTVGFSIASFTIRNIVGGGVRI